MFNKILVAIDRSPANQEVFNEALSLAKATKANLILLHVLSGEEEDSPIMSLYPTVGDHYLHLGYHRATKGRHAQPQEHHVQRTGFRIAFARCP